jgi:hypothetical protein|tara:strand:- start:21 stop:437 length:417 start_codon:yes stop_codon:yes gene_type:complete
MELKEKGKRDSERDNNRGRIYDYVTAYIDRHDKAPTKKLIAEHLRLNIKTVTSHMKALTNSKELPARIIKYGLFFDKVTRGLIKKASEGDVQACRLYYSLVWGFNERDNTDNALVAEKPIINITTTSPFDEGINISNN